MAHQSVIVEDVTRGLVLAQHGHMADTPVSSFFGLMGKPPLPEGHGLVISPCSSIHTHFMRFPIDVIYVDRDNIVVGVDRALKPWRFGRFYKKVHCVVELSAGAAAQCQPGDTIAIRPTHV